MKYLDERLGRAIKCTSYSTYLEVRILTATFSENSLYLSGGWQFKQIYGSLKIHEDAKNFAGKISDAQN